MPSVSKTVTIDVDVDIEQSDLERLADQFGKKLVDVDDPFGNIDEEWPENSVDSHEHLLRHGIENRNWKLIEEFAEKVGVQWFIPKPAKAG